MEDINSRKSTGLTKTSGLSFREILRVPLDVLDVDEPTEPESLDDAFKRIILDFKRGRFVQCQLRFADLKEQLGFLPDRMIVAQPDLCQAETAPLIILENLVLQLGDEALDEALVSDHLDALKLFDPGDEICQAVLFDLLSIYAARLQDFGSSAELIRLALAHYRSCNAPYLEGFMHVQQAYLQIYRGNYAAALSDLGQAQKAFEMVGAPKFEMASVTLTRAWVTSEHTGVIPGVREIEVAFENFNAGGFWQEVFLASAALCVRSLAASDPAAALERLAFIETALRARGLDALLSFCQILREELLGAEDAVPRPDIPQHYFILLLPTAQTLSRVDRSWPEDELHRPRITALKKLTAAKEALASGRLDIAAPLYFQALKIIEDHRFIYLLRDEAEHLRKFLSLCVKRRRFEQQARHVRDVVLPLAGELAALDKPDVLTKSEYGVLQRLPTAMSNKALAKELEVAEVTVKFHLKKIYRKLGVHSRQDALKKAVEVGWIPVDQVQD